MKAEEKRGGEVEGEKRRGEERRGEERRGEEGRGEEGSEAKRTGGEGGRRMERRSEGRAE